MIMRELLTKFEFLVFKNWSKKQRVFKVCYDVKS